MLLYDIYNIIKMSLIGKYVKINTYSGAKNDDYDEIVYCNGISNGNLNVQTKNGKQFMISINSDIYFLPNPSPVILYPIGTNVEFVYDYHWHDGEYTTFGKIVSYRTFYNDVMYSILNFFDNSVKEYSVSSIKRIAHLKTPLYKKGQYVSVITKVREHQLADDIKENCIIVNVAPEFDKIKYTVKLDSGATMIVEEYSIGVALPPPKTPQQLHHDDMQYLFNKEQQLLLQLEVVRNQMKQMNLKKIDN
jgi:hypothetical protein